MQNKVVAYVLSRLVLMEAAVLLLPLALAIADRDRSMVGFLFAALLAGSLGMVLYSRSQTEAKELTLREGVMITGLGWLVTTFLGMLPYVNGDYLTATDALFESISGFTTTGATTFTTLTGVPRSILLWRALTNWLGGLGIIVIFIALLPQAGTSALKMYQAEGAGPTEDRVLPRLRDMTKALFGIYLALTALAALLYFLGGLSPFEALSHAMATISGGGFSSYDDSAMHFKNLWIEGWMAFFMALAGGSFALYYRAWQKGPRVLWRDSEFRAYVLWLLAAALVIALSLVANGADVLRALRAALFQTSSLATTGFVSADFDTWPPLAKGVMLLLMLVGGCGGSTASGLKVARVLILFKGVGHIVSRKLSPRRVVPVRLGGSLVEGAQVIRIGGYFFLYMLCLVACTFLMTLDGASLMDSFSMAVTSMGNIGPGFGAIGATRTYAELSDFSKLTLCFFMLLGRLEIMTLLVMLRPGFWQKKRYW